MRLRAVSVISPSESTSSGQISAESVVVSREELLVCDDFCVAFFLDFLWGFGGHVSGGGHNTSLLGMPGSMGLMVFPATIN